MALTDTAIRQALPKESDYWLTDARGLRLLIKTNGSRYWRLKYRFDGKQKTLAIGVYPVITLKAARERTTEAKLLVAQGIDPSQSKKKEFRKKVLEDSNLFSLVAKEWWEHQKGTWTPEYANRLWGRLDVDVFPFIGLMSVTEITPQDVIAIVRRIEGPMR